MKRATLSNSSLGLGQYLGSDFGVCLDTNGIGAAMGGNDPDKFQCVHGIIILENVKDQAPGGLPASACSQLNGKEGKL